MQYLWGLRRNYVALPALGVAYARIPKSANSTIKRLLAEAAGIDDRFGGRFSSDSHWRGKAPDACLLTGAELRRRHPDLFIFTVVRDPLARLAACWRSKISRADEIPLSFRREGLTPETTFRAFADHAARRADWRCNVHYRAQAHILGTGPAPDFVGRFDRLDADWPELCAVLAARGVTLPPLPPRPRREEPDALTDPDYFAGDQALIARLRARYAEDYRLYFPDL